MHVRAHLRSQRVGYMHCALHGVTRTALRLNQLGHNTYCYLFCSATFYRGGVSARIARAARRMAGMQRE